MSKILRKPKQETIDKQDYELGRDLAEKCFNNYLETGQCLPGSSEYMIYCEIVAGAMSDNAPLEENMFLSVMNVQTEKNSPFYNGMCDFLLDQMVQGMREKSSDNLRWKDKLL